MKAYTYQFGLASRTVSDLTSVCPPIGSSVRSSVTYFQFPIHKIVSQNVTNKSYLVFVGSKKYVFLVILGSLEFMRRGKAELCT